MEASQFDVGQRFKPVAFLEAEFTVECLIQIPGGTISRESRRAPPSSHIISLTVSDRISPCIQIDTTLLIRSPLN